MKLSCMEWNINGRGGYAGVDFPAFIADIIMTRSPDIVILVEFCKRRKWEDFCQQLSQDYFVCISEDYGLGRNQVLIAIKKALNPVTTHVSSSIPKGRQFLEIPGLEYLHPEFLQVDATIEKNGERASLSIIGTRIKVEGANQNYINRAKQFSLLISHLYGLTSNVIVMGDFNNGKLRADIDAPVKDALSQYTASEAKTYNYHKMKEMSNGSYHILTPQGKQVFSWPIALNDNKVECGPFLQDHCIVNAGTVPSELMYSYLDFATAAHGYTVNNFPENNWGKRSLKAGLPDHAYLYAEIELEPST